MNIYFGDLHNHCGITYGFGSLENAIARAKSHLDFAAFTGHAMWPDMYEKTPETEFTVSFHERGFEKLRKNWEKVRATVANANSENFVTFQGYEIHSRKYGDHHLVSPDDGLRLVYRNSPAELVRDCGVEAIAVPHHIGYTPGYRGIDWDEYDSRISPIVEVYSKHGCAMSEDADYPYYHNMGPRDTRNMVEEGLRRGNRFSFVASTDHHAGFPGSHGDGLAAVVAENLTKESLWEAILAGRTYGVTGDRILCDFRVNDVQMGGETAGGRRRLEARVETEGPLDKIILYKNGRPCHVINGESYQEVNKEGCYKLRVEMGWGKKEPYRWNGVMTVRDGEIENYHAYFRGKSVLAPAKDENYDENEVNNICTESCLEDSGRLTWACDTFRNQSTLHPLVCAVVVKIKGNLDTRVTVELNGKSYTASIGELLEYGYTCHMEYYHSQAFRICKALPESRYRFWMELEDTVPEKERDYYYLEVAQKNRQWAYVSPVYVRRG